MLVFTIFDSLILRNCPEEDTKLDYFVNYKCKGTIKVQKLRKKDNPSEKKSKKNVQKLERISAKQSSITQKYWEIKLSQWHARLALEWTRLPMKFIILTET